MFPVTESSEPVDEVICDVLSRLASAEDFDNWKGAYAEIKVADEMGAENIEVMGKKIGQGTPWETEIDILKRDGTIVEVKNVNKAMNIRHDLNKKIPKFRHYYPSSSIKVYVPSELVERMQTWADDYHPDWGITFRSL